MQSSSRSADIVARDEAKRVARYTEHVSMPLRAKLEAHSLLA